MLVCNRYFFTIQSVPDGKKSSPDLFFFLIEYPALRSALHYRYTMCCKYYFMLAWTELDKKNKKKTITCNSSD